VTDPDQNDLPELELDPVEPVFEGGAEAEQPVVDSAPAAEPEPVAPVSAAPVSPASVASAPGASAESDPEQGQWVWQYAAPPPPPSFGAAFFSGTALPELYRFFGCALLVVVGCLLPWGPMTESSSTTLADGTVEVSEELMAVPGVIGVETTLGALSLIIGLWLLFSSCYSIYTRRQKILPVFLMIEPAIVTWMKLLETNDQAGSMSTLEMLDAAGTGLLLTLIGSTLVAVQFFFVVGKVYTKKEDKGAARRSAKSGAKGKGADGADKKDGDAKKKKDEGGKGKRGRKKS